MYFDFLHDNPLIFDVTEYYKTLRRQGYGRDQSVNMISDEFSNELNDEDDRDFILIAIAIVLGRRKELTHEIQANALQAIDRLRIKYEDEKLIGKSIDKILPLISDERIGAEAKYRTVKQYDPGWKVGDTFIHEISHDLLESMDESDRFIVLRKVGEYTSREKYKVQLVYVSLCSHESIPHSDSDFQSLGYVRMMPHDIDKWDYLGQLHFKSKKDEDKWELQKIGCFPEIVSPKDAAMENPLVSMPLFGIIKKELIYEEDVCRLKRENGIGYAYDYRHNSKE